MILHDHRHFYDFSKNHKIRRRFIRPIRDRMPYLPLAPLKPENLPNWKRIDYGVPTGPVQSRLSLLRALVTGHVLYEQGVCDGRESKPHGGKRLSFKGLEGHGPSLKQGHGPSQQGHGPTNQSQK